ncbi:hypothetical protein HPP92_007227 [Vanilla planifolia]|uniref:Uncharacterized protein n=1 Tax=Vanilla planifolia TaxID=51239 RepID=A0A835RFZ0_VANPL|nr:hypothetical protein HPP92_007227 [Vanilla planifolia]
MVCNILPHRIQPYCIHTHCNQWMICTPSPWVFIFLAWDDIASNPNHSTKAIIIFQHFGLNIYFVCCSFCRLLEKLSLPTHPAILLFELIPTSSVGDSNSMPNSIEAFFWSASLHINNSRISKNNVSIS